MYPSNHGAYGARPDAYGHQETWFDCPHCERSNRWQAYFCRSCNSTLTLARLTSLGTGMVPKGFAWELTSRDSTLGRALTNDVSIPSKDILPVHVKFVYCIDSFFAHTDNPQGDVTVDGETLILPIPLQEGSKLAVGVELFEISYCCRDS